MNRTYSLVWNRRLKQWVAASELARSCGMPGSGRVRSGLAAALLVGAIAGPAAAADLAPGALPTGGTVAAGQAAIATSGNRLDVTQGSQRAIINWQGFDIGSQAQVNFAQPNSSAVALNRVSGPTATRIEGRLNANGQVFLINPNGILFGGGARVNVGGLVASTLNIRDADFLAGNYSFAGSGGSIENQGAISAAPGGYLAFIAPKIINSGTISAPQGTAAMGAGERVTLNFAGDRLVGLAVSASTIDTLIANNQAIRAEGGAILLTAAGAEAVTRSAINNTGVLEASSLTSDGGRIVLSAGNDINLGAASTVAVDGQKGGEITVQAQAGTLLADGRITARGAGGTGGSVQLLGHQVGLVNAAQVDASGATGGGTVLVGGDYQGGNATVQNAFRAYVAPEVTIKADALQQGDGGKVIVWADDVARFYGKISSTGGALAGNGGFVEVSGKGYLDFNGVVDTAALNGSVGTLLLDPTNIEVVTGGTATLTQVDQFADPDLSASCAAFGGAACSRIAPTTINAAAANVVLQATNNILISDPVSIANPGVGFTATAQTGSITVNAPITTAIRATSGTTGAVTLSAGGNVVLNADITTGSATVADAAGNQTGASGNIGITAGTGISGAGRLITGNAVLTGTAAGTETIRSGTITLNVTGAGAVGLSGANALTIGAATGNGAGSTATSGNITFTSADRINNGTAGGAIDVSFGAASGGATSTVGSLAATTDGGAGASGEIVITSGEALRLGAINAAGGAITLDVGAATTAAGVISGSGTSLTKLGAGTLTLSGANTYTGATNINTGTLALGAAERISNTSAVTVALGATFNLGNFAETIGSLAGAGTVTKSGATARTLAVGGDNTSTTFSGVIQQTGTGTLSLTKNGTGTLTLSGANTYTGTTTINAGTLRYGANNAINTGAVVVSNGGTYDLNGFSDTIGALTVNSGTAGGTVTTGSGTLTLGGNVTSTGGAANASISGNLNLGAANRTVTTTNAADGLTISAVISGPRNLTKAGAGTLTLSGANTYTGATTINAGTLVAANNTALGTTAAGTTVASGATLALQGGITVGAEPLSLNGSGVGVNGALRNLSGDNTWGGTVRLSGNAEIQSDAGTLTLSAASAVTNATATARSLTVDGLGNVAINGTITTTTGALTKNGSGTLILSGANTYTGTTTISAGTLTASNATALGTTGGGTTVAAGATLNINNVAIGAEAVTLNGTLRGTGAGASLAGTVALNSAGTTIDTATATDALTLSGVVSGANTLTKTGTGTLTLGGVNTYTGAANINAGTLAVTANNALGTNAGGTTVVSGATLDFRNVAYATAEAVTLNGGTLATSTGTSSFAGSVTMTSPSSISVSGSQLTLGGAVTAPFALAVTGGGSLTAVNPGNDFSTVSVTSAANVSLRDTNAIDLGASTIAGNLALTTNGAVSDSGVLTIGGATTINAGAPNDVTLDNANDFAGNVAVQSGRSVRLNDINNLTLDLSSFSTLTATAVGTVRLAGQLTASGPGDAIVLSGGRFVNSAGAAALTVPAGSRWLVWSSNPNPFGGATSDSRGGLAYDFKQYNATFGITPVAQPTGNGFVYSLAPTITPALTGTVSKVYDGNATATLAPGNLTASSAIDGDTVVLNAASATFDNQNVGTAKTVAATGITASASNGSATVYGYAVSPTTASANIGEITPAPLTVTSIAAVSTPYATPAATGAVSLSGVIGGDAVTSTASLVSPTFSTSNNLNAGSYAQNASSLGGADAGNYTLTAFTTPTNNYTVTQLALSGAAIAASNSAYGSPLNPGAVSFGNVQGTDVVTSTASVNTSTLSSSGNPIVGSYTQTAGALAGTDAANYSFAGYTTETANYAINPLALRGSIAASDKIYDGTTAATIASRSLSGVIGSDSVLYSGGTASFLDKNAGTARTVTATGLGLSGSDASNYTVNSTASTTANITPAPLVITANDASRPIDTPNPPFTATYTGLVAGETPNNLNGVLQFSTPATTVSPVGAYPITPFGQTSSNYTIVYVDGVLQIVAGSSVPGVSPVALFDQQTIAAQYSKPEFLMGSLPALLYAEDGDAAPTSASSVRIVRGGLRIAP